MKGKQGKQGGLGGAQGQLAVISPALEIGQLLTRPAHTRVGIVSDGSESSDKNPMTFVLGKFFFQLVKTEYENSLWW